MRKNMLSQFLMVCLGFGVLMSGTAFAGNPPALDPVTITVSFTPDNANGSNSNSSSNPGKQNGGGVVLGEDGTATGTVSVSVTVGSKSSDGGSGTLTLPNGISCSGSLDLNVGDNDFDVTISKKGNLKIKASYTSEDGKKGKEKETIKVNGGGCGSCGGGSCSAGSTSSSNGCIDFSINLGKTSKGQPRGFVRVFAEEPQADITKLSFLKEEINPSIELIRGSDSSLRQIHSEGLVNFVQADEFKYQVEFYHTSAVGVKDGSGFYTTTSAPFRTVTIENGADSPQPGELCKHFKISNAFTYNNSTSKKVDQFIWSDAAENWALSRGEGAEISRDVLTTRYESDYKIETRTIEDSQGRIVSKKENWYNQNLRNLVEKEVVDPDGAALTTKYRYRKDSRLEWVKFPNGGWERYVYIDEDNIEKVITPFGDAAIDAPENQCRVEETKTDDQVVDGKRVHTTTNISRLLGVETSRSYSQEIGDFESRYIQATVSGAAIDDSTNRVTVTKRYDGGEFIRQTKSVERPDGTMTIYTYNRNGLIKTTTAKSGIPDASKTDIIDGTMSISQTNNQGTTIFSETYDIASGIKIDGYTVTQTDEHGRATRTDYDNGTYTTKVYGCCGVLEETDVNGTTTSYAYDSLGRTSYTSRNGITTFYSYDADGRTLATRIKGKDGTEITTSSSSYDLAGRLTSSTDQLGLTTTYSYSGDGLVETVTNPNGTTNVTTSNIAGDVVSTVDPAGIITRYSSGVDEDGSQWSMTTTETAEGVAGTWNKTITDFRGRTIETQTPTSIAGTILVEESVYDDNDRLVKSQTFSRTNDVDTAMLAATLYQYNAKGEMIRSGQDVDGNGALDFASMDRISETTRGYIAENNANWLVTTSKTYTKDNDATAIVTGKSKQRLSDFVSGMTAQSISIDIHGNETVSTTSVDRANKTVIQTTNSPFSDTDSTYTTIDGLMISQTDNFGQTTTFEYDEFNRQIAINDPRSGRGNITVYNDKGQVVSVTDSLGATTTYEYDNYGRRSAVVAPRIGRTNITVYDDKGQVISVADASGAVTQFEYDDFGRQTTIINANGKKQYSAYDLVGNIVRTWGETTYPVAYGYDILGRKTSMTTFSDSGSFTITWDDSVTGNSTSWNYDSVTGSLLSKTDAKGNATTYSYNRLGQIATRTWARTTLPNAQSPTPEALITSYSYNDAGQQVLVDYSDSTTDISYSYDQLGRQASVTDAAGTRTFSYNAKGLRVSETLGEFSIDYGYDSKGRNDGFILNQGQNLLISNSMSYDATGRLSSAVQNGASVNYNYLANSHLLSGQSLHNGAFEKVVTYEEKRNLPISIGYKKDNSTLAARNYTFDAIGRITNRTQERVGETTRTDIFGYNDRDELISATVGTDNFNYNFDNLGNRVSSTEKTETLNYTVNEVNQYSSISSSVSSVVSPTFDADGNQTTIHTETGTWQVEYNAENRPITFVQDSLKITCEYDYQGRRISKKVYEKDEANNYQLKTNNYFLYNGYLQIANFKVENEVSSLEATTFWDPAEPQATRSVAMQQDGKTYYYSHDFTKNVCELFSIDEQNNVNIVRSYDYTPFGAVTEHIVDSSIENLNNNFKFSSEFYDLELALIYYNYRHYNPLDGRWINRDPIEERGGLNLYGMVGNNPNIGVDKQGQIGIWGGFVGVATGWVMAKLTDTPYNLTDAAIDFGLGMVGAGLGKVFSKAKKVKKLFKVEAKFKLRKTTIIQKSLKSNNIKELSDLVWKNTTTRRALFKITIKKGDKVVDLAGAASSVVVKHVVGKTLHGINHYGSKKEEANIEVKYCADEYGNTTYEYKEEKTSPVIEVR